jgi:hypothetical protein
MIVLYAVDPLRMCATDRKTHIRVLIFPNTRNIAQLSRGSVRLARFDSKSFLKRNGPSEGTLRPWGPWLWNVRCWGRGGLGSDVGPVDHIFVSASLSEDEKADILGRTAAKLFNFKT